MKTKIIALSILVSAAAWAAIDEVVVTGYRTTDLSSISSGGATSSSSTSPMSDPRVAQSYACAVAPNQMKQYLAEQTQIAADTLYAQKMSCYQQPTSATTTVTGGAGVFGLSGSASGQVTYSPQASCLGAAETQYQNTINSIDKQKSQMNVQLSGMGCPQI